MPTEDCTQFAFAEVEGKIPLAAGVATLALLLLVRHYQPPATFVLACQIGAVGLGLLHLVALQDLFMASSGLFAIASMQVASEALAATSGLEHIMELAMLGNRFTINQATSRVTLFSAVLAMFVSSDTASELLLPGMHRLAKRNALGQQLIVDCLLQSCWVGGYSTLLGSVGTNLVLASVASQFLCLPWSGLEVVKAGLPVTALLLAYNLYQAIPHQLLQLQEQQQSPLNEEEMAIKSPPPPVVVNGTGTTRNKESMSRFHTHFTFDALVPVTFNGKTIEDAGFRNLDGLFLTSARCGNTIHPVVGPEFKLKTGDRISFAGVAAKFLSFCNERGLIPVTENDEESYWLEDFTLEAVVSASSDLVGKSMKRVNFRTRYGASVLAIHRVGQHVKFPQGKLGQVVLQVGDLLLLVVSDAFDWQKPMTRRDLKPRFATTAAAALYFDSQMPSAREYIFTMKMGFANRTVGECGLGEVVGARIIAVSRGNLTSKGIAPSFLLQANDILWFSGERDGLLNLRKLPGLEDVELLQISRRDIPPQRRCLFEAAVGLHSDLLHKTVRESRFGTRFGAVIVAIQRQQESSRKFSKIADIELQPGDVLLVDAESNQFNKRFVNDDNFLVISSVNNSSPPRMDGFPLVLAVLAGTGLGPVLFGVDISLFALLGLMLIGIGRVLPKERVLAAIRFDLLIGLASLATLGVGMAKTGVAYHLAGGVAWTGINELGMVLVLCVWGNWLPQPFPGQSLVLLLPMVMALGEVWKVDCTRMIVALVLAFRAPESSDGGNNGRLGDWRVRAGVQFVVLALYAVWYLLVPASLAVLATVALRLDDTLWDWLPQANKRRGEAGAAADELK
ncbi:hypothetical protein BASA81_007114 [Batrachochytrium salamandrivorans]|nr:hypothetical protein BASA81_007114 [Batrachochytrium salamandrivorans]